MDKNMKQDMLSLINKASVIAHGIVRDKDGNPKIDDPKDLPPAILAMLTPQERAKLGVE